MRKVTPKKYAQALYELIVEAKQEQVPEIIQHFVELLVRTKSLSKAGKIIDAFRRYYNEQTGIIELNLASAKPLDVSVKSSIISMLEQALQKRIELTEETNPALVGGLIVKYGDTVIDGSVRKRLEVLSEVLKK